MHFGSANEARAYPMNLQNWGIWDFGRHPLKVAEQVDNREGGLQDDGILNEEVTTFYSNCTKPWLDRNWIIECSSGHQAKRKMFKELERVQRRWTRMLQFSYKMRREKLGPFSPKDIQERGRGKEVKRHGWGILKFELYRYRDLSLSQR